MVLGMVEDVRVVLIRLASRTQTLRFFAKNASAETHLLCARNPRHLRAARQPPRRLAAQVGARGPVVPLPRARALQAHRADAGREAPRARALHRERDDSSCRSELGAVEHQGRDHRAAEAHLLHLEQDARQAARLLRGLRRARAARHRARGEGLLRRARRGAQPVAADPEGVRRLHLASQGQPLPVAAHRGARPGRQDAGSADPHRGDAPPGRVRRRRALAVQGRRQGARKALRARRSPGCAQLLAWRDEVADQASPQSSTTRSTC